MLLPALADGPTGFSVFPHRGKVAQLVRGQMEVMRGGGCSNLQAFDEVHRPCRLLSAPACQSRSSRRRSLSSAPFA